MHSVGLAILRHARALQANEYRVHVLGTQNSLKEIFRLAPFVNVVMPSSMDGDTRHDLREFPELMQTHQVDGTLCYLGGNLTIGGALGYERCFGTMGFDRVFVKFTDLRTGLKILDADQRDESDESR